MHVTNQELLHPDTGTQLPSAVRQALIEMGDGCNQAALAVNRAAIFEGQVQAYAQPKRALQRADGLTAQVIDDLERLADLHHEQALIVMARAAAVYVVYASQVATAVARGETPPLPQTEVIRPSDLITACGHYLPPVEFNGCASAAHAEQNKTLAESRGRLVKLINDQMQGEPIALYDDLHTVDDEEDERLSRISDFPDALHEYAAALVWSLSVFSGIADS